MTEKPNLAAIIGHCQDQKGLIACISDFLYRNNGNIVSLDQHIDQKSNLFLFRVEWNLDRFSLSREEVESEFSALVKDFSMTWRLSFSREVKKMAIFASLAEHCLMDIVHKVHVGDLSGQIPLIISNHEKLQDLIRPYNIPFHFLPVTTESKKDAEREALQLLKDHDIDFMVLARYMQILSSEFVGQYTNRIINIHHSFLPAFIGSRPYHQAFHRGVKIIGATGHYVTNSLDDGPIIEQDIVRISHRDQLEDMIQKGKDIEKVCLSRAVKWHLEDRVLVYDNKTVVFT